MMKNSIAIGLSLVGTCAFAQGVDFTQTSTADLIVEMEYIATLSKPVDDPIDLIQKVQTAYIMKAVCGGQTYEQTNQAAEEALKLIRTYTQESLPLEIRRGRWDFLQDKGCTPDSEVYDAAVTLLSVMELDLMVKAAVLARQAEIIRRTVVPTDLTEEISDIADALAPKN